MRKKHSLIEDAILLIEESERKARQERQRLAFRTTKPIKGTAKPLPLIIEELGSIRAKRKVMDKLLRKQIAIKGDN